MPLVYNKNLPITINMRNFFLIHLKYEQTILVGLKKCLSNRWKNNPYPQKILYISLLDFIIQ